METAIGSGSDAAIREQLDRILSSPQFRNSKRSQALLRFVTEGAVENRLDDLREKIIGFRVFGRDVAYDTGQDGIVRSVATEVRKRLAQYYLEEGHHRELRIDLPAGSYVPSFTPIREKTETIPEDPLPVPEPKRVLTRKPFRMVAMGVGLAAVVLAAGLAYHHFVGKSDFDRFWAPVFAAREPVQIVVGQPVRSYRFIGPRQWGLEALFQGPNADPKAARNALHPLIGADEIRWNADRYLYVRDAFAMTRLGALVRAKGSRFRMSTDPATNYSELRGSPVIAIGAFDNGWARRLGAGTRFSLSRKVVDGVGYNYVADRNEPNARKWMIPNGWMRPNSPAPSEDYAIVTRVVDPNTERTVILVAGIADAGTQAASEFVTEPEYMNAAFRKAARGWERRNIQLVLHTNMIGGTPGPAKVVAMHFW